MKKLYTLWLFVFAVVTGNAQTINFPDANFKATLLASSTENIIANHVKIDANDDGEIQISEAQVVTYMDIHNYSISSLEGIQYFTSLIGLDCSENSIGTLDMSLSPNLENLTCHNNVLTSLNVNGLNNLTHLICYNNHLTTLDISNLPGLINVQCFNNQLISLNASNDIHLENLACNDNLLVSLDVSGDLNLGYLACHSNQLTSIDVSGLSNLQTLSCSDNNLTSMNISGATFLSYIWCSNNQLSTIDLEGMSKISYLQCNNNLLTSLEVPYTIYQLNIWCNHNNLTYLNIKNGVTEDYLEFSENPNLLYVCSDEDEITTVQNKILGYGYANCVLNSYCSFAPGGLYYTIQGNSRFDEDNNGCDVSDHFASNLRFAVTGSSSTSSMISNGSGHYELPLETGTHIVTPTFENPNYFSASPPNMTVTFPEASNPFNQDFCIAPNGSHNDLEVILLPLDSAIPGFDVRYGLLFKNKGTTTQNGILNLSFDDAILDLISSSPLYTSQSTNMLTWNFSNLQPFESRYITLTFNINSPMETPPVNGNENLNYTATLTGAIDETPSDNSFSLAHTTVISYDPNDKTCLEGSTITPSMVGQYVHYVIRFENNGTANATNIVVKDIIDTSKFNINSLVPLNGSHQFVTRINNATNKVEFIFENINLPFDDANNDGYVAFKIKTKPTLVVGDTFSNSANIYFDYNFPIVTNTFTTTIQTLATQDFDFATYFNVYPNPADGNLTIETKSAIGVKSMAVYNLLGQIVIAIPNAENVTSVDVSNLETGTYFLKVNTDKGSVNTKFIKH